MFRSTIVGYDGSRRAQDALALAAALSSRSGGVTACCAHHPQTVAARIDPTEPRLDEVEAERCLAEARELAHGWMLTETFAIEAADPAGALLQAAASRGADLLVVGSSHRGRVGRVLLGDVAVRILHEAPCPVAVARVGQRDTSAGVRIASIAVGCDVVEDPGPELALATSLAVELGASLHVVAVAETSVALAAQAGGAMAFPAIVKARRLATEEGLAEVMSSLPKGLSVTGEVREGTPSEKLAEVSHGVDLLVLGSHHYRPLQRLVHRSVADSLARHSSCPILVVPPPVR